LWRYGATAASFQKVAERGALAWETVNAALNRRAVLLGVLLPFAVLDGALLFVFEEVPWTSPDSWDYVAFAPWRTLAYPVFIRLLAVLTPSPAAVAVAQLSLTLISILFFVDVIRRVLQGGVAALLAGLFLLTSWPLLYYSFTLLTDQLFVILLLVHFGFAGLTAEKPTALRLLALGATTGIAVALRPAGYFLLIAIPVFVVALPDFRKRIAVFMVFPLAAILLAVALANFSVFGYFGLSSFAGGSMVPNMAYLLRADTPTKHPELAQKLLTIFSPFQAQIAAIEDNKERFDTIDGSGWLLVSQALDIATSEVTGAAAKPWQRLTVFDNLSALNRLYGSVSGEFFVERSPWRRAVDQWGPVNELLADISWDAHRADPGRAALYIAWKLYRGWTQVMPSFSMRRNLSQNEFVDPNRADLKFRAKQANNWSDIEPVVTVAKVFDGFAAGPFLISLLIPVPLVVFLVGTAALWRFGVGMVRRQQLSPRTILLAYVAAGLFLYHLEIAVASIANARYLTATLPLAALLLVAPLTLGRLGKNGERGPAR
jgi:hypothetical protein